MSPSRHTNVALLSLFFLVVAIIFGGCGRRYHAVIVTAWSSTASSRTHPPRRRQTTTLSATASGVRIGPARLPQDLSAIRACRKTELQTNSAVLLDSQRRFYDATALTESRKSPTICILARESWYPWRVLGTADLVVSQQRQSFSKLIRRQDGKDDNASIIRYSFLVRNVIVRKDCRGRGLAKRLLLEGVEPYALQKTQLATTTTIGTSGTSGTSRIPTPETTTIISLQVETRNTPAVRLYQSCGYTCGSQVDGLLLALSELTRLPLLITMTKKLDCVHSGS